MNILKINPAKDGPLFLDFEYVHMMQCIYNHTNDWGDSMAFYVPSVGKSFMLLYSLNKKA